MSSKDTEKKVEKSETDILKGLGKVDAKQCPDPKIVFKGKRGWHDGIVPEVDETPCNKSEQNKEPS